MVHQTTIHSILRFSIVGHIFFDTLPTAHLVRNRHRTSHLTLVEHCHPYLISYPWMEEVKKVGESPNLGCTLGILVHEIAIAKNIMRCCHVRSGDRRRCNQTCPTFGFDLLTIGHSLRYHFVSSSTLKWQTSDHSRATCWWRDWFYFYYFRQSSCQTTRSVGYNW